MKIAAQLNKLLLEGISGNQNQLVGFLSQRGVKTTQSTVSRALKKINAIKGTDNAGDIIYSLPKIDLRGQDIGIIGSLVNKIVDNGNIIVINTKPGTANTVAKFIDDHDFDEVLGSVAGDDTIMVVPSDVMRIGSIVKKIRSYLIGIGVF
ncbi:MAG: arginine repressor [Desulfobacteraceae bacterium]|nr:arginine repressor [Desulfobacteraceae bacterium]